MIIRKIYNKNNEQDKKDIHYILRNHTINKKPMTNYTLELYTTFKENDNYKYLKKLNFWGWISDLWKIEITKYKNYYDLLIVLKD